MTRAVLEFTYLNQANYESAFLPRIKGLSASLSSPTLPIQQLRRRIESWGCGAEKVALSGYEMFCLVASRVQAGTKVGV